MAYRAIMNTLAFLKVIDAPEPEPIALDKMEYLSMEAVHDRLDANDQFSRVWSSFDNVAKGDLIGTRADGTAVLAEYDGKILFPDVNAKPNNEWFYMTRPGGDFERYAE